MAVPKTRVSYSKKKIRRQQWFKKILNSNKKIFSQTTPPLVFFQFKEPASKLKMKTYKNFIELLFTYKTQVRKLVKDLLFEKENQNQIDYFQRKLLREKLEKAIKKRNDSISPKP